MLATTTVGSIATVLLAGFLILAGLSHFVLPQYFRTLVPPWSWLPSARWLVAISGAVEVVLGIALVVDVSRPLAAWGTTALMAAYVTTHLDALARSSPERSRWLDRRPGAVARVLVNLLYLGWALAVAIWASGPGS